MSASSKPMTVKQIAARVGLSERQTRRLIRRAYGVICGPGTAFRRWQVPPHVASDLIIAMRQYKKDRQQ